MRAKNHLIRNAILVCALLAYIHVGNLAPVAKSSDLESTQDVVVYLQEGITTVDVSLFYRNNMEVLHIPSSVEQIAYYGSEESSLRMIVVDEGNSKYTSINGLLFSKDEKRILFCPPGYECETLALPDSTKAVGFSCFENARRIKTVVLPEPLEVIGDFAFDNSSISSIYIYGRETSFSIQAFNYCPCLQEIWVYKESEAEKILIEDVDYIDLRTLVKYIAE